MTTPLSKEKRQIVILSSLFVLILVVIGYTQRAAFLPQPGASEGSIGTETRAAITIKATDQLFDDVRFTSLKDHVEPSLKPSTTGNGGLFGVQAP